MSELTREDKIKKIIEFKDRIPANLWVEAENGRKVLWFLDDEDGTSDGYDTSQHRFGITREGEIIWGFSSGCSCWEGWCAEDYDLTPTYKEFIVKDISFIGDGESQIDKSVDEYFKMVTKNE